MHFLALIIAFYYKSWYNNNGDYMNNNFIIKKINRVILVGKNEYQEKNTIFPHNLKNNELILHLSGKSRVKFNGKILNCESGTIRFLPKGENKEYIVEREEHGECLDVFFDSDIPISDEAFVLKVKNSIKIENLFKKLFSVWVSKNDGYYFESMSLLYKIFAEIQKENYIPQKQYDAIKPAIVYINENFLKKKISVSELSALCGISESYLKKLFLKKFAVPPIKYIIQLKINYACDLLRSNLYSITQAAEICGYSDPHFFCRQFKTYMGITPTEFVSKYKSSK